MACFCCCDFLRFSISSLLQGLTRWWHLRAPTEVQTPTHRLHLRAPTEVQTPTHRLHLRAPTEVQNPTHRLRARFLKSFLDCSERWQIEDGKLKAALGCLELQLKDAYGEVDGQISFVGEKHARRQTWMHINTYTREVYDILTQTPRSMLVMMREADVMGPLESLLEDTEDLLKSDADSILPVKKELEDVNKSLRFLKSFLHFTESRVDRKVEMQKDLLAHADAVAFCIACLLYLYCSVNDKIDDHAAHHMKMELEVHLEKIKPVQPEIREIYVRALKDAPQLPNPNISKGVNESALVVLESLLENLIELSEAKLGPITSFKDQILALHQELKLLKNFLIDPLRKTSYHIQYHEQFCNFCRHTYSLTIESGYVIFSLYDADNDQDRATELRAALSDLQAKVEFAKGAVRETFDKLIPKLVLSNFPRTNFQGFITSFLQKLVKYSEADAVVKDDVIAVQRELLCLRDDFCKIAKIRRQHEELNHHWAHFIDVTYQAEHVIESLVVSGSPLLHLKFCLFDVIEEIKMIRTELNNTQLEMTKDDLLLQEEAKFPRPISAGLNYRPNDALLSSRDFADHGTMDQSAELVAFDKGAERIQNLLASEEEELQIVSIVGLPGIGKTTLADSVYGSVACFHIRARVCVSKAYQRKKLLLDILQGVTGETEKFVKMEDTELEHILQRLLRGRRYLIFMDDIWDTKPWLEIRTSLPDDKNGSRIMFTSRSHDIASQTGRKSITYQLDLLSKEKSWEMLYSKLFKKNESCRAELEELGKEIANRCKGLPLTIDVIAGVLRTMDRTVDCWKQIAEEIRTQIADPQQRCQKVLERSYNDLPDHLKPCFLYFGAFPEDTEIPVKWLIWLWIAEGFIQQQKVDEGLEKTAEAYLDALIARSLVTISKRSSTGGVKTSRVHDLLHDFACIKAKEEFFLLQKKGKANLSSVSSFACTSEAYRLICDSENKTQVNSCKLFPEFSQVRSIHCYHHQFLPSSFSRYRLLTVLDLKDIEIETLHPAIFKLVLLKFISLSSMQRQLLRLLPTFRNLETVFLVGRRTKGIFSVDNVWDLLRLRHFHVVYCALKLPERNALMENFQFANLLTLSNLCLCWDEENERMMRTLQNLQKLSCAVSDSWDSTENCNLLPKLDFLKQLFSLKMIYVGKVLHPVSMFSIPPYLKKLTLSDFCLPWSEISTIAELRELEVLKLRNGAFKGKIWLMSDGDFPKLRVLHLCKLDIVQWDAVEVVNNLPPLEILEVLSCENLEELPSWLASVMTLNAIRLWQCSKSLKKSAGEILKEQKDLGNENLEINRPISVETGWRERMAFKYLTWQ